MRAPPNARWILMAAREGHSPAETRTSGAQSPSNGERPDMPSGDRPCSGRSSALPVRAGSIHVRARSKNGLPNTNEVAGRMVHAWVHRGRERCLTRIQAVGRPCIRAHIAFDR
jgi:hypothetical protein